MPSTDKTAAWPTPPADAGRHPQWVASLFLRNARLADGRTVDVTITGDTVTAIEAASTVVQASDVETLDLRGYLLLAAPAEPHAHLDKAFTWERLGVGYGDLMAAVRAWTAQSAHLDPADIHRRGLRTLRLLTAHGVTAVRSHANICSGGDPLLAARALVDLRDEVRDVVDLQVVLLTRDDTSEAVVLEALNYGVDRLGGAPHAWSDPLEGTLRVMRLAAEAGVGVDLHVDEELDPSAATLATVGRQALRLGLTGRVTASHCVSLGMQEADVRDDAIEALRAGDVGVVTLPLTNLYLQGRTLPTSPPRGLTAVRALIAAGVTLGAGGDNLRDPFNPMSRGDPLEVASMLVTAGHLTVEAAYAAVSTGARRLMGLPAAGPAPGLAADLLAVRASSLTDAVGGAPEERITIRQGRVLARSTVSRWTALDDT